MRCGLVQGDGGALATPVGNGETAGDGATVTYVAAGSSYTCAVIDGSEIRCWGKLDDGLDAASADFRDDLGLEEFAGAANTDSRDLAHSREDSVTDLFR